MILRRLQAILKSQCLDSGEGVVMTVALNVLATMDDGLGIWLR
jgi:hypothetical protein